MEEIDGKNFSTFQKTQKNVILHFEPNLLSWKLYENLVCKMWIILDVSFKNHLSSLHDTQFMFWNLKD